MSVTAPPPPKADPIRSLSDDRLVAAVRRGEDRAFEILFERYSRRVCAYVHSMVSDHARAEDICQEVFLSALRRIRHTTSPIAFKPWIYEIARNACIDHFRRSGRAQELSLQEEDGMATADGLRLAAGGLSPGAAVDQKEQLQQLQGAFAGLSDAHHEILVLRELEGLPYEEIEERMGLSRAAVESTLFRARRRLAEEYDDLVSGRRCLRVQSIVTAAAQSQLGTRDQRHMERHLSHCQACRRHAHLMGLGEAVPERRSLRRRLAGLLPFPGLFRPGRGGGEHGASLAGSHGSGAFGQLGSGLGPAFEPLASTWAKMAVAVVAIALAGAGVDVATSGPTLGEMRDKATDTRQAEMRGNATQGTGTARRATRVRAARRTARIKAAAAEQRAQRAERRRSSARDGSDTAGESGAGSGGAGSEQRGSGGGSRGLLGVAPSVPDVSVPEVPKVDTPDVDVSPVTEDVPKALSDAAGAVDRAAKSVTRAVPPGD